MSPKSRGRRRKPGRAPRPSDNRPPARVSTLMLKDLRTVESFESAVIAESWASTYVGAAWAKAAWGDDFSGTTMGMEVIAGVLERPTSAGLAAVVALRRVAPPADWEHLDACIDALSRMFPLPAWASAPPAAPVAAWRSEDVWLMSRALFVDFEDETGTGHTLMLQATTPAGVMVTVLDIVSRDAVATWDSMVEVRSGVMPLEPHPVDAALAEMADLMTRTDAYWPRWTSDEYIAFRALFWSRCRDRITASDRQAPEVDRAPLLTAFAQLPAVQDFDPELVASLADLFLDFGEGQIEAGPLAWSPGHVSAFLIDWLPQTASLGAEARKGLPDILRAWVRFVLEDRDLEDRWIVTVEEAILEDLPAYYEAVDDFESWGPAQQIADEVLAREDSLTESDGVDESVPTGPAAPPATPTPST